MPQFDSKQAFDALAKNMKQGVPESFIEFIKYDEINIAAIVSLVSGETGRAEEDDNNLALFSAVVGSYSRWGYGDDPLVGILQGKREIGTPQGAVYTRGVEGSREPQSPRAKVVFGPTLTSMLDEVLEQRLGIGTKDASVAKWFFTVVSGVLHVNFPKPGEIGKNESFPVASATRKDLLIARKVIAGFVVSGGVPKNDEQIETVCRMIAKECSPTIVGGWLNLGLYMVSSWEYARRELVRETGDPKSIPNIRPIDDDSIIDCYACVFDLGPFRLTRVYNINHLCKTHPDAGQHKFEVTAAHANEARRLKCSVDPALAKCGICGGEYKDHTYERAIGIQLSRNVTVEECEKYLDPMQVAFDADDIDGYVMVETPEKFRVEGEKVTE